MLFHLYRRRLRSHLAQELLAGSGIAVAVALVFGVLVANTSLTSSAGSLIQQVIGSARVQLTARSEAGFEQRLAGTVERLPGVRSSAAVLRENVSVVGPRGAKAVQMLGVTAGIVNLGSLDTKNFGTGGFRFSGRTDPPSGGGERDRRGTGQPGYGAGGRRRSPREGRGGPERLAVRSADVEPRGDRPAPVAQRLVDLPGRVTQVLVQPRAGADRLVAGELRRIAGGRLDVAPADNELRLLDQAIKPNSQSTELFSAISVMVGFLLALNAMLLTMPERRRFVADLRMQGYDRRQVLLLLSFQALALGVVASLIGVALGDALSSAFFHRVPTYLAAAFPIGAKQIVHARTVLAAFGCGVIATVLASLTPAIGPARGQGGGRRVSRVRGQGRDHRRADATRVLGIAGMASIAVVTALVLIAPDLTIVGGVALALTTLLLIPAMFAGIARALPWMGDHIRSSALVVAVSELRATSMRAVALAGIVGLAVYGSIAIGGARGDLIRGIDRATAQYFGTADIWVGTGEDIFNVNRFEPRRAAAAIARAPGVASVRSYQGGLLDVGTRRLWIRARPPQDSEMVEASQLLHGDLARTTQLLRQGGWAAVSSAFAGERHLRVGDTFSLPTPSGTAMFRTAAIMTNSGWPPGTITINSDDYSRYWQTADPSALEVNLLPGVSAAAGRRAVTAALGHRPGLSVRTSGERDTAIGGQRTPGTGDTRRDLHAAADRGGVGGRLGAERGRVAATRAACLAEDPGV